jgi:hypothetical protein
LNPRGKQKNKTLQGANQKKKIKGEKKKLAHIIGGNNLFTQKKKI